MKAAAVYAVVATAASAVSTAAALPVPGTIYHYDLGGVAVPVVPAIIGILATLLVRVIVVTKRPSRRPLRIYNVAVTLLAMLGAVTFIAESRMGPGTSFWVGIGCGAAGVALVEIGQSQFAEAVRAGLKTMFHALQGPRNPE